ncbi:MAG TPA: VWA domain-containing protein [Vicinamibacterales bacterium]|jgi:hypothetical protein
MYPFGTLQENLAAFCEALRRQHGFRIGPRELADAARTLALVSIGSETVVRDALRPILCRSVGDMAAFDAAFTAFFHAAPAAPDEVAISCERPPAEVGPDSAAPVAAQLVRSLSDVADDVDVDEHRASIAGLRYSPLAAEGDAPELVPPDSAERAAAHALVNRLQRGLSRRWRPSLRGRRFDLRRTLRVSLHTAGEPVVPRWRARVRRRPKFVIIVDGSRSMGADAMTALRLATALASATKSLEAFTFSTTLHRITPDVQRASSGERRRLGSLRHAWGGGTSVGRCLQEFLRRHGDRYLGPDTVVMVASDGLDVGEPRVLGSAMAALQRRSAGIVWLNPLIESNGYQPTASGMRIARPFLSTFSWASGAEGLIRLSRTIRLRAGR